MGLDKKFRVSELFEKGSKAIHSENEDGEHTFIVPPPVGVGDRDGETYGYVEKPNYNKGELKKAIDWNVDELFTVPEGELPDVVPLRVHERLQDDFISSSEELATSSLEIQELLSTGSELRAVSASLNILYFQSLDDYDELTALYTGSLEDIVILEEEQVALVEEINSLSENLQEAEVAAAEAEQALVENSGAIEGLRARIEAIDSRLSAATDSFVQEKASEVSRIREELDRIRRAVNALEGAVDTPNP